MENFSITLSPHRSLSRQGYHVVMALVVALNVAGGGMFLALGAWPVMGFMGLDVLIIWFAFRRNFRDSAMAERIMVEGDRVMLSRYDVSGVRQETTFNRRWLRIELEYDEARELIGRLLLKSHGVAHEIASFLGAEERQALAKELRRVM